MCEVFDTCNVIEIIHIDDQELVLVARDPFLIMFIQVLEILKLDIEFEISVPLRNLLNKLRDVCLQVDQKIWWLHEADHRIIDIEIALVIAIVDMSTRMKILRENVRVFVYRAVLYSRSAALADLTDLVETTVQKIDLQMECPLRHITVEVAEVRVLVHRLKQRSPSVMLRELFGECTFSGADVTGNSDVSYLFQFRIQ